MACAELRPVCTSSDDELIPLHDILYSQFREVSPAICHCARRLVSLMLEKSMLVGVKISPANKKQEFQGSLKDGLIL